MIKENSVESFFISAGIYLGGAIVFGVIYPMILGLGYAAGVIYFLIFPMVIIITSNFSKEREKFLHKDGNGNIVLAKGYAKLAKPVSFILFLFASLISWFFWSEMILKIFIANIVISFLVGFIAQKAFQKGYFETKGVLGFLE
ncbi:hypothetical protein [Aureivirga marina]|uniref:hypothetical protein n=1 Tax=Aureivirga marina TaxID=1182451 RepID=UPI0018C96EEF|nr:hypothetical protein [Aureivirga marina]